MWHHKQQTLFTGKYNVLDITAGYRYLWKMKRLPELGDVLFLDKREEVKPDIVADNEHLPIKDNCFKYVVYDPPHMIRDIGTFYKTHFGNRFWAFESKNEMLKNFANVNREAYRVAENMIFKWSEIKKRGLTLDEVLKLLDLWEIVKIDKKKNLGYTKNPVYYVWLRRKGKDG